MGTISNSLASSGTSSSKSAGVFTGTSSYSKDFQNVIDRAVAIASLPLNLMTGEQTALNSQATELSTLDTKFSSLRTALLGIETALGGGGMQTVVSQTAVAAVTVGDGAAEGAYTLHVAGIGSYATSLSAQNWNAAADPSGQPTTYDLVMGNNTYQITPANNSASSVASAINAQFGNLVQATAVNVGHSGSPDYRLSLKSAKLGPLDLKLQVPAQANLQWAQAPTSGYALSQSTATWDASGSPSSFTLLVDGVSYALSPTDNSASSVASAINGLSGNPVQATVVDLGTSDSPDYRIQLQSRHADEASLDLQDALGNSLQQQQAAPAAGLAVSRTAWAWDPTLDTSGAPVEYTLTLGDSQQTFTVDDNSATGVAAALNALSGSPVQAVVIDLGTGGSHDYRVQLTSNGDGKDQPALTRNAVLDLQNQGQPPGQLAQYEVSNSGVTVASDTRSIKIAAGTTVNLLSSGTTDITVTRSTATLSTALSAFADAYNAVFLELNAQHGQSAGPLQGNPLVTQLSQVLAGISTYSASSGQVSGLASLGLNLGTDGRLSYSPYALMATDISNSSGVTNFLGTATGGGFLQAASKALQYLQDPAKGLLHTAEGEMQTRLSNLSASITEKQNKVSDLQLRLQDQMARADAAIAAMEQQYSFMSSLFSSMQTSNQMFAKG